MFNPLKILKKKDKASEESPVEEISDNGSDNSSGKNKEELKKLEARTQSEGSSSSADIIKISTELDRIKASVESFAEVRKGFTERMNNMSEQIGELRAMIMDRDRSIRDIELKAVKAADLVESVQPEKLMIQIQKEDAKFEALKANLEGNEAIMNRIMDELR